MQVPRTSKEKKTQSEKLGQLLEKKRATWAGNYNEIMHRWFLCFSLIIIAEHRPGGSGEDCTVCSQKLTFEEMAPHYSVHLHDTAKRVRIAEATLADAKFNLLLGEEGFYRSQAMDREEATADGA